MSEVPLQLLELFRTPNIGGHLVLPWAKWRRKALRLRIEPAHESLSLVLYHRGTSLIRNCPPLGPYSRTMPRALW